MNELYHYGVLGQKWGVRRYQNPDGTLKPAGKKRYSANEKEENFPDAKKERRRLTENQKKALKATGVVAADRVLHQIIIDENNRQIQAQQLTIQQANNMTTQQSINASINAANMAASLSLTGGMNPFMFGMF